MKKQAPLPSKDKAAFNNIVKLYEQKHYKKAVKVADNVLKRHPNHGETMSMKGLALNEMGKKEEAMQLCKLGIMKDMKSHVTWHVLGLIHRSNKNYPEAVKCYQQALRIDPKNMNILRDTALLQIQSRDHRGFVETRRRMLTVKSTVQSNWIGFAVGHHLSKNYDMAVNVLKMYESTVATGKKAKENQRTYDNNEIALYGAEVLIEAEKYAEALEFLEERQAKVLDADTYKERRGQLLVRLGRFDEARTMFEELLNRNPENYVYHRGLQCALLNTAEGLVAPACTTPGMIVTLTSDQVETLLTAYNALRAADARCRAFRRVPLDFLPASHPEFRRLLDFTLRRDLRKGNPSLWMHLKSLYAQEGKAAVMQELVLGYIQALEEGKRMPVVEGGVADATPEEPELAVTTVWAKMFAGRHFDMVGEHAKSLQYFDEAILHTPTILDLYMWRGRTLKHAGQLKAAAASYDQGRRLDLADRYISAKTAKYQLRAGMGELGEVTANLFSRDTRDCTVMQCMWFEIEAGDCHYRNGDLGKALQKYKLVEQHFLDYEAYQFDFHHYCLRKMTLRSYLSCMKLVDDMPFTDRYVQAITGAVRCFLALAERAASKKAAVAAEEAKKAETKPMNAKQRRAAARRAKRLAAKKSKATAAATAAAGSGAGGAGAGAGASAADKKKQTDAEEVTKLEATENPLEEAATYARKLADHKSSAVAQLLVFEVAMRRGKLLQALRALRTAASASADGFSDPKVFVAKMQFITQAEAKLAAPSTSASVQAVVREELAGDDLLAGSTAAQVVDGFVASKSGSLPHRIAAAEALVMIDTAKTPQAVTLLGQTTGEGVSLASCFEAHKLLVKLAGAESAAATAHKAACLQLYPLSTFFGAVEIPEAEFGCVIPDSVVA